MKLALAGFFLMLSAVGIEIYATTADPWAAIGAAGFALGSIFSSTSVLKGYKGEKR